MTRNELENRLIDFSVLIVHTSSELPTNFVGKHLGNQLIRSGISASLNYGEAIGGESRKGTF